MSRTGRPASGVVHRSSLRVPRLPADAQRVLAVLTDTPQSPRAAIDGAGLPSGRGFRALATLLERSLAAVLTTDDGETRVVRAGRSTRRTRPRRAG